MNVTDEDDLSFPKRLNGADKWILTRLNDVVKDVTINLNKYEIGLAAAKLYDFTWSEFCDWYIEMSKPMLYSGDKKAHSHAAAMLTYVLTNILKLLHPFVPFITEEIYSKYAPKGSVLMVSEWPAYNKKTVFRSEEKNFEALRETIVAIRNMRAEMNVPAGKKIKAYVIAADEKFMRQAETYLEKLAGVSEVTFVADRSEVAEKTAAIVTSAAEVLLPLGDMVDTEKEKERLQKEIVRAEAEVKRLETLLANKGFVSKAPQKLVDGEREKLAQAAERCGKLKEKLHILE